MYACQHRFDAQVQSKYIVIVLLVLLGTSTLYALHSLEIFICHTLTCRREEAHTHCFIQMHA